MSRGAWICSLKLVWLHITWHQEWKWSTKVLHVLQTNFIHLHFLCLPVLQTVVAYIFWRTRKTCWKDIYQWFKHRGIKGKSTESAQDVGKRPKISCVQNAIWWKIHWRCQYLWCYKRWHFRYISFILSSSIIEKGWIDATFLQKLKNNNWAVVPGENLKGLAQNVKMDHKKSSCCPCSHASMAPQHRLNQERCKIFGKLIWFLSIMKKDEEWETWGR